MAKLKEKEDEMEADQRRGANNEEVLDTTQTACVLDATKGSVRVHVGPVRLDLAEAKDRPVSFDGERFIRCRNLQEAIEQFPVAKDGDYIVLQNPSKGEPHPEAGKGQDAAELAVGREVVISGPASFPLWPGQTATVIPGHQLRSNQYLMAQVINEEDARKNWAMMVGKSVDPSEGEETGSMPAVKPDCLAVGQQIVVKGTELSFFIPPTGVRVIPDENGKRVRPAGSLERLEYCILVGEDGNKRFVYGPDVVFPQPTETFVRDLKSGSRKFRAIELNELSGIYGKVIADYEDENQPLRNLAGELVTKFTEGMEFFVTGKDQRIYWPRAEHAIIRYASGDGDDNAAVERHFAVAIPEGEGRYVLSRMKGNIDTRKGPDMALLDPRKEVFIRRILSSEIVKLWFPGNQEAVEHNTRLAKMREGSSDYARERSVKARYSGGRQMLMSNLAGDVGEVASSYQASERAVEEFGGEEIKRARKFTPPRSVTLDTKYEGAVLINVWTGFAVQIVSKTGKREVVEGPLPRLLDYDESLEVMSLSTGTPKAYKTPLRTVYLRVKNNRVSDEIEAETADLVRVRVKLSYRVNFEGEKENWFSVENYVGLLTERCRSIIKSQVKKLKVRDFNANSVDLLRDMILGRPGFGIVDEVTEEVQKPSGRPGLTFAENGMHVYDVEVLDVNLSDPDIAAMLVRAQQDVVRNEIALDSEEQGLRIATRREEIARELAKSAADTKALRDELALEDAKRMAEQELARIAADIEKLTKKQTVQEAVEVTKDLENERGLARDKSRIELEVETKKRKQDIDVACMEKQAAALVMQVESIQPGLIAALQTKADVDVTVSLVEKLTPLATLTGQNVPEAFKSIVEGTALGALIDKIKSGNGSFAHVVTRDAEPTAR